MGAGPTAVALKQDCPWTYCVLANHIWSFAGNSNRDDISSTFLQPFLSYTTPEAWTFALNTESELIAGTSGHLQVLQVARVTPGEPKNDLDEIAASQVEERSATSSVVHWYEFVQKLLRSAFLKRILRCVAADVWKVIVLSPPARRAR